MDQENSPRLTFGKAQKLCSKKDIEELYQKGSSFFIFPFKVIYTFEEPSDSKDSLPQYLISVPKRRFSKAHDRNHLKRRIRESIRLQQIQTGISACNQLKIAIIYSHSKKIPYEIIENKINLVLIRILEAWQLKLSSKQ
jgi:ribonuclease P protein component